MFRDASSLVCRALLLGSDARAEATSGLLSSARVMASSAASASRKRPASSSASSPSKRSKSTSMAAVCRKRPASSSASSSSKCRRRGDADEAAQSDGRRRRCQHCGVIGSALSGVLGGGGCEE